MADKMAELKAALDGYSQKGLRPCPAPHSLNPSILLVIYD